MQLPTAPYCEQTKAWPASGRHILAQYDDESIVVYQAYSPAIGHFAIKHQRFGGEFKYSRMSWIKPNFLWMMYRCDWGRSDGQQVVLGMRIRRTFFDEILAQAVPSSYVAEQFPSLEAWKAAVESSDVRLQWDPDHLPTGQPCERRAIQLGLRGKMLEAYGQREIVGIIDMSEFLAVQRQHVGAQSQGELLTPAERVYMPPADVAEELGLGR